MKFFEKEKIGRFERNYYIFGKKIWTRMKKKDFSKLNKTRKFDTLYTAKCLRSLNAKINTAETLIIGHSHARLGFIEDEKSINFGIDSQDLYYSYMILDKYKNMIPNLKNVVLFFAIFSPGHDLILSPDTYRTIYYDIFMDIPYKNKLLVYQYGCLELAKKVEKLKKYVNENLKNIPTDLMAEKHKGNVTKELEDRWINRWIKLNKLNTEMHFVKNMLDICESKGLKLTIVLSPYNPRIKHRLPSCEECFGSLFEITKNYSCVQILNTYDSDDFVEDDFLDIEHLDVSGAKKITNKINKIIRE